MTGEFVIPAILGGNKGVLMGGLISSQYLEAANYSLGSAMAVLVLVVLGVAVADPRAGDARLRGGAVVRALLLGRRYGSWSGRALALWTTAVFVFLFAPIVTAVIYSFNKGVVGRQSSTFTGATTSLVLGRLGRRHAAALASRSASRWRSAWP